MTRFTLPLAGRVGTFFLVMPGLVPGIHVFLEL